MRNRWKLAAMAAITALLLSACAGGGGAPAAGGGGAGGSAGAGGTAGQPARKGPVRLVIGSRDDIQHWDIHNHNYTHTEAVHQHVFDYLVYYNLDTAKFDPGLATEWKVVNPTTWEFKLRPSVKFHNGEPFDGQSVKFTLERVSRDKKLAEWGSNRTIKEVEVVDPLTVRIHTHTPDPILLNRLSRIGSGMLPAKYLAEKGWDHFQKEPVGTGAYKVKEWVKDDHLTLTAWDGHWRGKPKVDELVFRVIPEAATRIAELQTGGIDIALGVPVQDIKRLQDDAKLAVHIVPVPRVYLLNVRGSGNWPVANPKVRAAIDYAIDKNALIQAVAPGMGVPVRTRITPGILGHPAKYYNTALYDPEKAKQLLREAGYPNGVKIGILSRSVGLWADIAQSVAGMLEKVGFKVELDLLATSAYNQKLDAYKNPDIFITSYGNSMKDPDLAVIRLLYERNKGQQDYKNDRLEKLIPAAAAEFDPNKRAQLYAEISDIVAEDRPQIFLWHEKAAVAVRKGVNWKPRWDEMYWLHDAAN